MDYRDHDRGVWEGIFRGAPDTWLSAPPSALMTECRDFLRRHGVTRALDLGSGFGRWTNFVAAETRCSVVGIDYAVGGCILGSKLAEPAARSGFVAGEMTSLPFADATFDGFVAVLVLDNVARPEGRAAVRELDRVTRAAAPGFVVLNPWPMPAVDDARDNPTQSCTRHDYGDNEARESLLARWQVLSHGRREHDLRLFEVRT